MINIKVDQLKEIEVEWEGDMVDVWNEMLSALNVFAGGMFDESFNGNGEKTTSLMATAALNGATNALDSAYDNAYKEHYGKLPDEDKPLDGQIEMEFEV